MAADFNADGKLDVAFVTQFSETIVIMQGNGDGTFTQATSIATPNLTPSLVIVGDFNGDGRPDLAVGGLNTTTSMGFVTIYLGNGYESFTSGGSFQVISPAAIVSGDFNNDRKLDIALSQEFGATLLTYPGNGDGTFANPLALSLDPMFFVTGIATADFNHDGKLDLALVLKGSITVATGNGDGRFKPQQTSIPVGSLPVAPMTADFNGDGEPDIVVANYLSNNLSVLSNSLSTTASATLPGLAIAGTSQNLQASYPSDSVYAASKSNLISLAPTHRIAEMHLWCKLGLNEPTSARKWHRSQ